MSMQNIIILEEAYEKWLFTDAEKLDTFHLIS
jgi:hypothetical protein